MMFSSAICALCKQVADFDGDRSVSDDLGRDWCKSCASGALALAETSPDLVVTIARAKKFREAERLELRAAELRKEAGR